MAEPTDWLLETDPAIRWQVLRDLRDAPAEEVAAQRSRVATEGWGAQLLAARDADGRWAAGACFPAGWRGGGEQPWTSTLPVLMELHDLGLDPASDVARETVALVAAHCRWEYDDLPFFDGEVEPCINGRTVTLGAYFGVDVERVVDRLLADRLADGGWNCDTEQGSTVSSFASTINVLEGLLAYERATGGSDELRAARRGGEQYLLERALMRRRTTGEVPDDTWVRLAFPVRWHYDVLRALEYFRRADVRDERLADAIGLVRAKRGDAGSWPLELVRPGAAHVAYEDVGRASRWITLRASRVLRWWDGGGTSAPR